MLLDWIRVDAARLDQGGCRIRVDAARLDQADAARLDQGGF
jgi:hypothetical protein